MKVKIGGSTLLFTPEACNRLSHYVEVLERSYDAEVVADIEGRIVELILEQQSAEAVVEKPLVESIIATIGYPEGHTTEEPKAAPQPTPQPTQNQGCMHSFGEVVRFCLKAMAWIFVVGWILAGLCVIIGIIALTATDAALVGMDGQFSGVSPIGFSALLCGSWLMFMIAVAYLLICLLRHKRVSGKSLLIMAIIWLFLTIWAWFGLGRNISNWEQWGYDIDYNMEQFEERIEDWAERYEDNVEMRMESLEYNMEALEDSMDALVNALDDSMDYIL